MNVKAGGAGRDQTLAANVSYLARLRTDPPGHQLPLTLANPVTAMWPIAVIRPVDLNDSNAA
jgi:hypothetical protein